MFKCLFVFSSIFLVLSAGYADAAKSRGIEFDYEVVIKDIPADASEVKIWLPQPPQNAYQEIEQISSYPEGLSRITYDKTYHNKIIYYILKSPENNMRILVNYKIRRYEHANNVPAGPDKNKGAKERLGKYLVSNRLMVVTPEIKQIAQEITKGKKTVMEKARAIYDYVFENVSYNKTIPGWGEGDTKRVCLLKAGNCTDFHSLFVSLARSIGIPANFVIGFSIPKGKSGQVKSYHCWAEFYDDGSGWVPVDVNEYYFGSLNEDRIEFSQGRDIILEPAANSEPLNYFIYPYVEVNGKKFQNVETVFRFKDEH